MIYHVQVGDREVVVEINSDDVTVDGSPIAAQLIREGDAVEFRLLIDGRSHRFATAGRGEDGWLLVDRGMVRVVAAVDERTRLIRSLAGTDGGTANAGILKAPMPGMVVRTMVTAGQRVEAGDGVVVLEAMKMENELRAPITGVVNAIHAKPGGAVDKGAVLVEIDPDDG